MPESEQLNKAKFRVIIYHGHIHILPKCEKTKDNDNINEIKNPKNSIISEI